METDVKNTPVSEEKVVAPVETQPEIITKEVPTGEAPQPQAGEKTDSALLLKSLQEERDRRRELEVQLQELSQVPTDNYMSDDEVSSKVNALQKRLDSLEEEKSTLEVTAKYPALKDNLDAFNEYKKEYPRHKLENVAKLFLSENDLLDSIPRKGLEPVNGGQRQAPQAGMTVEDVKTLRETNFKKYSKMLQEGKINI